MKTKENIKFQDDRDGQQTDVGGKKYQDNESVISGPGEFTAGPFTFHISHIEPDLREMIVSVADQYNRHTESMIINVSFDLTFIDITALANICS